MDIPSNMAILNNSQWSILGEINKSNKGALLHQLTRPLLVNDTERKITAEVFKTH